MASIRKTDEGTWRVFYRDPSGRQRNKTFKRKVDADRFAKAVDTDVSRGEWLDPRLAKATVGEYADRWFGTITNKPKTKQGYESYLRNWVIPELGALPVSAVDRARVKEFAARIENDGLSASTRDNAVKVLRLVLGFAVDAGAIRANPAMRLKLPRGAQRTEMCFLTVPEVKELASAIQEPLGTPRFTRYGTAIPDYGLLVKFAANTGMRAGEIEALRVKDVDVERARVTVTRSLSELTDALVFGDTKTGKGRALTLPPFLVGELHKHLRGRAPDDLVFAAAEGGPMRHSNFYVRHFKPAVLRAGLQPSTRFHDLRHTHVAWLIRQGAHPKAIMARLGHSSINVTLDTYGHLFPDLEGSLADGLDDAWAGRMT